MSRLDSIAPAISEGFSKASSSGRRRAAVKACELAVWTTGLEDEAVDSALVCLRGGVPAHPELRKALTALAAQLDDERLEFVDGTQDRDAAESLEAFSKARAASALAYAVSGNDEELQEAIYEAFVALGHVPAETSAVISS